MSKLKFRFSLVLAVIIFTPLVFIEPGLVKFSSAFAQTGDQCTEQLNKAEEEYQAGRWTESIELIEQCLKKTGVSEAEKGRAYRILGLVYIAIQLEKEANDAVKNLLIMVPNYKVDPVKDPPSLQKIIDNMAQTLNPKISGITPNTADEGDNGFIMTVTGSNFVYGSLVKFNGTGKKTTYVSPTELKAEITQSDLAKAGGYDVTVYSPILGGKTSNPERFMAQESASFPWTWIAIGGGVVAAVVVAVVALGGGNDDNGTPTTIIAEPPGRP